jgi:hypothetical protein
MTQMEIHSGSLPAEMQAAVALAASDKALYVSYLQRAYSARVRVMRRDESWHR